MAPPPHQTESTPSYLTGSARAAGNQVPTPFPTFLGGGSTIRGQAAWWPGSLPQATFSADTSTNCGMYYYPPGGFMNFLQTGQPFIPHFSSPWPPMENESQLAPPKNSSGNQNAKNRSRNKTIINLDEGNDVRTAKRLVFDPDEDERLVSAWLFHSSDPINGNCKKNKSYWGDVHELYNKTTPTNRKREKATSIYLSGYSDDQLRDMAKQFYLDDYPKEGAFTVEHCWKILYDEPKWHAILEELEKPNKRSLEDEGEAIDISGV
uniref:No apical meristem-associated C-terminal domain-containing protein n=1 Tax=Oryza brachyantha TaxID=4533 RepID=J3KVC3_ORYBR